MPLRIAVIAEAEADRQLVCELIDRKILQHAPDWWGKEQLDVERVYCGLAPGTLFTPWTRLNDLPSPEGALRRGGFIGFGARRHLHWDYPLGRKALVSCALAKPEMQAVILIRDMDQQPEERAASLAHACGEIPVNSQTIVLALPRAKREAWVLNGFDPKHDGEHEALAQVRENLGFDPRIHAERLNAMEHGAKRDAKRVLKCLIGDDREREAKCWRQTSWAALRERGVGSGLTQFLSEVKEKLVPLVAGVPTME